MNPFALSSILVLISCLSIGIVTLIKGKGNRRSVSFSLFAFTVALWGFGAYKFSTTTVRESALLWWQIAYISVILTPVVHYYFIYTFLNLNKFHAKLILIISFILGSFFIFCNFLFPALFLGDLKFAFQQFYYLNWLTYKNPLYLFFVVSFWGILLGYSLFPLLGCYKNSSGVRKNQFRYLILASAIGWFGAECVFLPIFGINIYPYSNFLLIIYPIIISYAIIKYRILDIKVAITRTGIFIAVYTLVLGLPFAVAVWLKAWLIEGLGPSWWMLPLILMAILATVGPFIYIYINRKAEDRLLREQKRYQETLKQASAGMARIRNLRKLLDLITHIVTKTVKISYAAIYLYNEQTNEYVLQVSRDKDRVPVPTVSSDNPLLVWIMLKREPLIYEEVKRHLEETQDSVYKYLEENMRILTASVVIPSFLEDKFVGFIVLGDKVSGQIYTSDDLNVFQVLASQAALAIENAQFYEEAKEMQEQISQAEKMATLGTMADGLSHQINNRFYALSLIAGDTVDTIKMTDTSKCTPEVKDMIDQINHALERIQANVMQGGEVVKGILKYTRKEEESFEALTIDQVLDSTLEMVQYKIKLSEFDLVRNYPQDAPKIKGNIVQLQEVFFNLLDNAYDAIVERRTLLKEDNYRGKIVISAELRGDYLMIIVEDNGMGVKAEDMNKLFAPFFTTKTSSRRGTGLGLYVIRRIITDTHKGKISFESNYKTGTSFIIELLIAKS